MTDIAARFSALNITWMGAPAFENIPNGKAILKDAGTLLAKLDPYNHPRTSMAEVTSSPLAGRSVDELSELWHADPNVGAVEHQFYAMPAVNTGIQSQRDLWNATMNGQYPASGSGKYMTAWFDFMSGNRYWELEPYFDVDGGRAVALEDVEYIVYVEKPGPVELTVEDHGYDVAWINPATGERIKAKNYKGKHFTGEPPDKSHDWVLQVSREGHKEGMLKSYKFDSRRVPIRLQEIEANPQKMPFEVAQPDGDISMAVPPRYSLKIVAPDAGHAGAAGRSGRPRWCWMAKGIAWREPAARGRCISRVDRAQTAGHVEPARVDPEREWQGVRDRQSVSAGTVSGAVIAIDTTSEFGSLALAEGGSRAGRSRAAFARRLRARHVSRNRGAAGAAQSQDHGHRRIRRGGGARILYRSARGPDGRERSGGSDRPQSSRGFELASPGVVRHAAPCEPR